MTRDQVQSRARIDLRQRAVRAAILSVIGVFLVVAAVLLPRIDIQEATVSVRSSEPTAGRTVSLGGLGVKVQATNEISVSVAFTMARRTLSAIVFQTANDSLGIRMEINDSGSLLLSGSSAQAVPIDATLIDHVEVGRRYVVDLAISGTGKLKAEVDGRITNVSAFRLAKSSFDSITLGNGLDDTRPLDGTVDSFDLRVAHHRYPVSRPVAVTLGLVAFAFLVVAIRVVTPALNVRSLRSLAHRLRSAEQAMSARARWVLAALGISLIGLGTWGVPYVTSPLGRIVSGEALTPSDVGRSLIHYTPSESSLSTSRQSATLGLTFSLNDLTTGGWLVVLRPHGLPESSSFGVVASLGQIRAVFPGTAGFPLYSPYLDVSPDRPVTAELRMLDGQYLSVVIDGELRWGYRFDRAIVGPISSRIDVVAQPRLASVDAFQLSVRSVIPDVGAAAAMRRLAVAFGIIALGIAFLAVVRSARPVSSERPRHLRGLTIALTISTGLTIVNLLIDRLKPESPVPYIPRNSILFIRDARFSDYFELAYIARTSRPYQDLKSMYPPGYFLFQRGLNILSNVGGFTIFVLLSLGAVVWWLRYALGALSFGRQALYTALILVTYPVLFVLDRGNSDLIAVGIIGLAMTSLLLERRFTAGLMVGVAMALKLVPGVFILCLFGPRLRRSVGGVGVGVVCTTLLGGAVLGIANPVAVFMQSISGSAGDFVKDNVNASAVNGSLLAFTQQIGSLLSGGAGSSRAYDLFARPIMAASAIIGLSLAVWIWRRRPPLWASASIAACLFVLVPPISFDYRLNILLIPLVLATVGAQAAEANWVPSTWWWILMGCLLGSRVWVHLVSLQSVGNLTTAPLLIALLCSTISSSRGCPNLSGLSRLQELSSDQVSKTRDLIVR